MVIGGCYDDAGPLTLASTGGEAVVGGDRGGGTTVHSMWRRHFDSSTRRFSFVDSVALLHCFTGFFR